MNTLCILHDLFNANLFPLIFRSVSICYTLSRPVEGTRSPQGARMWREPYVDCISVPAARAHDIRGGRGGDRRAAR